MAWQEEMVTLLRVMLNDEDSATYTDDRLEGVLVTAARLVAMELDFAEDFAADAAQVSITPDPTAAATRDENFINLVTVKAACVVDRGAAGLAAGQALVVKDGSSQVDLRDAFKSRLSLLKTGWCAVYEQMKQDYVTGNPVGVSIVNPQTTCCRSD